MRIVYKVFIWNRKAISWDYRGNDEPLLFGGKNFTDKQEAIEYARQCKKEFDPEISTVDVSEYHFPDEGGDGQFIDEIDFESEVL